MIWLGDYIEIFSNTKGWSLNVRKSNAITVYQW